MATAKRLLDAGELDSGGLKEMVEIQAIKQPLAKKSKVNMQVDTTFIRGRTMRVFAEEKGTAPANGWVSREALSGNLTFRMEPPDACVYKPYDVTFHTEMKIEHIMEGNGFPSNMTTSTETVTSAR